MTRNVRRVYATTNAVGTLLAIVCLVACGGPVGRAGAKLVTQKRFPDPPGDLTRVYYTNGENQLLPLPFESGAVSVNVFIPAKEDKVVRVPIKGRTAATALPSKELRLYVFVADRMDPPPHLLVRLAKGKTQRELTISVIKGRKGYAPFESDNIKLDRRLLERLSVPAGAGRFLFVNYMEIRPLQLLKPGEYAIIGDSLADLATFRIE